jgi:hypothetical protein
LTLACGSAASLRRGIRSMSDEVFVIYAYDLDKRATASDQKARAALT